MNDAERYEEIVKSDWFQQAYKGGSLGPFMTATARIEELEAENRALKDTEHDLEADLKIAVEALENIDCPGWTSTDMARETARDALKEIRGKHE